MIWPASSSNAESSAVCADGSAPMRRVQALALAAPTRTRTVVRLAVVGAIVLVGLLASPTTIAAASLFRISQTDTMRVYVSIPQVFAPSIFTGLVADVLVDDLSGRSFRGTVVRTARAIDATTHTLLTEVDVPNAERVLLPGMNAHVQIALRRVGAPLVIPSTALVVRTGPPQVMELVPSGNGTATVHFRNVQVGRDNGSTIEIISGLTDSAMVATIGTQVLTEGQRVSVPPAASDSARGVDTVQPAIPSPRANSRPKTGRDSS